MRSPDRATRRPDPARQHHPRPLVGLRPRLLYRKSFSDLLTAGGRIHYDTHFGPLLRMSGELNGVTVDLVDRRRSPAADVPDRQRQDRRRRQTRTAANHGAGCADRRAYERELLEQRRRAETEQARVRVFAETLRRCTAATGAVTSARDWTPPTYYYTASVDDVGGDFYDLFPLSRTMWGFFIGDVVGQGRRRPPW